MKMQYLLIRLAKDGSTPGTSNEWTSVHSSLKSAIDKINSTSNRHAIVKFCAKGWRRTNSGRKPNGEYSTVYEYIGEN